MGQPTRLSGLLFRNFEIRWLLRSSVSAVGLAITCLLSHHFYNTFDYGNLLWNLVRQEAGSEITESFKNWQYFIVDTFRSHHRRFSLACTEVHIGMKGRQTLQYRNPLCISPLLFFNSAAS
jgi:hypothetical protein